jgi:hypothetical protein
MPNVSVNAGPDEGPTVVISSTNPAQDAIRRISRGEVFNVDTALVANATREDLVSGFLSGIYLMRGAIRNTLNDEDSSSADIEAANAQAANWNFYPKDIFQLRHALSASSDDEVRQTFCNLCNAMRVHCERNLYGLWVIAVN